MQRWQVDKLRTGALAAFARRKATQAAVGWRIIRDEIVDMPSTKNCRPEDGSGDEGSYSFKFEALRRFAEGYQERMSKDRMDDLAIYLIHCGLVTEYELQDDGRLLGDALGVWIRVGNIHDTRTLKTAFWPLTTRRGSRDSDEFKEDITLTVTGTPRDSLYLIEEHYIKTQKASRISAERIIAKLNRKGFAYLTGFSSVLNIYVRGEDDLDVVSYLQTAHRELAKINLLRTDRSVTLTSETSSSAAELGIISFDLIHPNGHPVSSENPIKY